MPIRFEIKPEVVEWVSVNCDLPAALAAELIRQLMTEMSVHNCISVTPAAAPRPEQVAVLVEAARVLLEWERVASQAEEMGGDDPLYSPTVLQSGIKLAQAVRLARAALASVEGGAK